MDKRFKLYPWCIIVLILFPFAICFSFTLDSKKTMQNQAGLKRENALRSTRQIWNLQDADIRGVIRLIARLTAKNFIVDPRVQGKITLISSKPLDVAEMYHVFLSMLQVLNYAAIPAGDVIKIVPALQAKEFGGTLKPYDQLKDGDHIVVSVVPVHNVSAVELIPVLRPLTQEWGNISAYQPSNALVISASSTNVKQIVNIIQELDNKNATGMEVVSLKYVNAKKLVVVVKSLQDSDRIKGRPTHVSLAADEQNNAILISGNLSSRKQLKNLIKQLDSPIASSSAQVTVVKLKYLSAKQLAPILTKVAKGEIESQLKKQSRLSSSYGVGSLGNEKISIVAETENNALVMSAPKSIMTAIKKIIMKLDTRPEQVLVQAIIVRVEEGFLHKLGIQWGMSIGGDEITTSSFPAGIGFIPSGSIHGLVQALFTNSATDVLATPSVLVLNNKEALISDGKNIGIVNRSYALYGNDSTDTSSNYSTTPYNTIERKDITLSLKVKPQIAPNNTVRLVIDQEDNSLGNDAETESNTSDNPTYNTSKIKTSVLVNSGDMLVLGGLVSHDNKQTVKKIPLLGDIPILGRLFKYRNNDVSKKHFMIFIRPIILHNRNDGQIASMHRYVYIRDQELKKRRGVRMEKNSLYPLLPPLSKRIHKKKENG